MIQRTINTNKNRYLKYTQFRKEIFSNLAPGDSQTILQLLPWLLSVNHPKCPGFLPELPRPFKVFNIDNDKEIRKLEPLFKRRFGVPGHASLLSPTTSSCLIQGIYTIGSIGTIAQTASSDCDIWICCDRRDYDEKTWSMLHRKTNIIKDWLDSTIRIPVYFFISTLDNIREGRFGSVDSESSGSSQKNVLKEEFYRTCILICGKIPLWWLCHGRGTHVDYKEALKLINDGDFVGYDLVDLGDIETIDREEYFGAALWQLHKSLTRPLKSIIKMVLLEMMITTPGENLVCHRFRRSILEGGKLKDPTAFSMELILSFYRRDREPDTALFLGECCYLRCALKPGIRNDDIKKTLADDLFRQFPVARETQTALGKFDTWKSHAQIELGNRIFKLFVQIYKRITQPGKAFSRQIDQRDLTILGRKLTARYAVKENKVKVVQKPTGALNIKRLTLSLNKETWHAVPDAGTSPPLISHPDIVYILAYIVWNDLFDHHGILMEPNPSDITLQEIVNLCKKLSSFIGTYEEQNVAFSKYLQVEHVTRLFVVVSFECSMSEKNINDFNVVYRNSWGELFVRKFTSPRALNLFLRQMKKGKDGVEIGYYLQRNCLYYEKIIQRTREILLNSMAD